MLRILIFTLILGGCQQIQSRSDNASPQPVRGAEEPALLKDDAVISRILAIHKLKDRVQALTDMGMIYWFDADSGHCFAIRGGQMVATESCQRNDYRYYSFTARDGRCLNSSGLIVDLGFCPWLIRKEDSLNSMYYKR